MMSELTRMPDVLGESIYHSGSSFVQCRDIRFYSRDHSLSSQEPRQGDITCRRVVDPSRMHLTPCSADSDLELAAATSYTAQTHDRWFPGWYISLNPVTIHSTHALQSIMPSSSTRSIHISQCRARLEPALFHGCEVWVAEMDDQIGSIAMWKPPGWHIHD